MRRRLLALVCCLSLAACGGGGGGGPNEADQRPGDGPRELLAAILFWQDMVRATDDAAFSDVAADVEARPLTSLSASVWHSSTVKVNHVNQILPLVGDAATDDYLTGLQVSGLRYHSWAAADFSGGLISGAVVLFASPE